MAKGPTWSRLEANATRPYRETLPYVGFTPTTPQRAAGCLIDPPVSLPRARGENPAATAAAEPPDEPPGTHSKLCGFLVGPKAEFSVEEPIANSSKLVLPMMTAPASLSFSITVAS